MKTIQIFALSSLALGLLAPGFARPAPASADLEIHGDAILRDWVQPEYPEAARTAQLEGKVTLEFVVEADGSVSRAAIKSSTDERFNAAALAALQRWTFSPALAAGKPVASGVQLVVVFSLQQLKQKTPPLLPPPGPEWPRPFRVAPPKMIFSPNPDYPAELEERKLPGQVVLEFFVETDGTARDPKVLWATDAAFIAEAMLALEKYRFEPAHQGPLVQRSTATRGTMEFASMGADRLAYLAANFISVTEREKFQQVPRPVMLPEPVYPRERLLAGEAGSATVEFTVTERGGTADVVLREASQPEFGAALLAAVEAWGFDVAIIDNQPVPAKLVVAHQFTPAVSGAVHRLSLALQPTGAGVSGAGGLDQRLRPLWQVMPVYPAALRAEKPGGQAMIEFIIDRDGRARLPLAVSATREEFGWAAAAAISQWVFSRPVRGGEPVDVKVSIPVNFPAPKD